MSSSIVLLSPPKARNKEVKIKNEILDIISFRPLCCNVLDEDHYRNHTYDKRFCNRLKLIKRESSSTRQADSFFADGKPGNLARVFAAIAPRGQVVSECVVVEKKNLKEVRLNTNKSQDSRYLTVE